MRRFCSGESLGGRPGGGWAKRASGPPFLARASQREMVSHADIEGPAMSGKCVDASLAPSTPTLEASATPARCQ